MNNQRRRLPWRRNLKRGVEELIDFPVILDGEVATLRVTLSVRDSSFDEADEEGLLRHFREISNELEAELKLATTRVLGPGFTVSSLRITKGSIDFQAVLSAVTEAVITYGALRSGVEYLLGDFSNIIVRYTGGSIPMTVVPTLIPGPALNVAHLQLTRLDLQEKSLLLRHLMRINLLLLGSVLICLFIALSAALD